MPTWVPPDDPGFSDFVLPASSTTPSVVRPSAPPQAPQPRTEQAINKAIKKAVWPFPNFTGFWARKNYASRSEHTSNSHMFTVFGAFDHPRTNMSEMREYNEQSKQVERLLGAPDLPNAPSRWRVEDVPISIPLGEQKGAPSTIEYKVESLYYRPLSEVIRASTSQPYVLNKLHIAPFRSYHVPVTRSDVDKLMGKEMDKVELSKAVRIYDEIFTSDKMSDAHAKLQRSPREPGCDLERAILPLMLASDATHPTTFGQAKVWPGYLSYGGISKYSRCTRDGRLMEHIAYFPTVRSTYLK